MPGSNIPDSAPFQVFDKEGEVTARVRPGSQGKLTWSAITGSIGILGAITGGSLLLTCVLAGDGRAVPPHGHTLTTRRATDLGVGVALTVTGVVLYNSGTTDVTLEGGGGRQR